MKRKVHSLPSTPVKSFKLLMKSRKLSILYPLTISMDLFSQLSMKLDNFVRDYLPEPPTPINIALPLGYLNTLAILFKYYEP